MHLPRLHGGQEHHEEEELEKFIHGQGQQQHVQFFIILIFRIENFLIDRSIDLQLASQCEGYKAAEADPEHALRSQAVARALADLETCTHTPRRRLDEAVWPVANRQQQHLKEDEKARTLELGEGGVAVVSEGPGEEVGDEEDERVHVPRHHRVGPHQEPRARAAPVLHDPPAAPRLLLAGGGPRRHAAASLHVAGHDAAAAAAKRHLHPRTPRANSCCVLHTHS